MIKGMNLIIDNEMELGVVWRLLFAHRELSQFNAGTDNPTFSRHVAMTRYHISLAAKDKIWQGCEATVNEFSQWAGVDELKAQKDRAFLAMRDAKALIDDTGAGDSYVMYLRSATCEIYTAAMNLLAAEGADPALLDEIDMRFKENNQSGCEATSALEKEMRG